MTTGGSFDEHRWVIQIRQTLDEEHDHSDEEGDSSITIFSVPKILMSSNPSSYIPQQVALGPYHHWRPELYEMEHYKLAAAKRMRKQLLPGVKFQTLVNQLVNIEQKIRGCYHKFLDFNAETLAWIMAMDSCFLLEFLQVYAIREGKVVALVTSRLSHLVDYASQKSAYNAIMRDIIMLENQIPLFVLRNVLEFQYLELTDEILTSMVRGLCDELFPFKMIEVSQFPEIRGLDVPHLLELLYRMIVPKINRLPHLETINIDDSDKLEYENNNQEKNSHANGISKLHKASRNALSNCGFVKHVLCSKLALLFLKMPWTIISHFPIISIFAREIQSVRFPKEDEKSKMGNNKSSTLQNKAPLVEEIIIPSVVELEKSGICFVPTTGGISSIHFDPETVTFHLPTVSLDVNSDVVLRNLVAFEATSAMGPLVFTRYTELMNGIIDVEEDVKILRGRGIILNHLKSDQEVADLWNGMSKSIRLTKVHDLDKVIEDVNKYYNGRWKIRVRKFMKSHVFGSWQLLTLFAAILLLLLMSLQAFCSIYNCIRNFHYVKISQH